MILEDLPAKSQHKALSEPQQQWHLQNQEQDCFHNTQPPTTNNNRQVQWHRKISLPRTKTRHNDNHIYDFIKKYIVNIILLLYIVASMAIWLFDWFSTRNSTAFLANMTYCQTMIHEKYTTKLVNYASTTQPFTVTVIHSLQWIQIDRPVAFTGCF